MRTDTMTQQVKIIECPRDAMQGWPSPISTLQKIQYLNQLLKVGFDTLDCVSFVSPRAIPQMADSADVLEGLNLSVTGTKLLAIIVNVRGAETASDFDCITYLGYPFSISPTFQKLNTNSTPEESWERVLAIQDIAVKKNKKLVIYISMGVGNPYGDPYDASLIGDWVEKMRAAGIAIVSLADTVGLATPTQIKSITGSVIQSFPDMEIGVHLHSTYLGLEQKLEAAWQNGCRRFDGAMKGAGGCPMANNPLVGNMDTEKMIDIFHQNNIPTQINMQELATAAGLAAILFQ